MARQKKIALIGTQGYERQSDDLRVDCYLWERLVDITNLRDYDIVILNLLSIKQPEHIDWSRFSNNLNVSVMREILQPGGKIVVIGDPRFSITKKSPTDQKNIEESFLAWTGVTYRWDDLPGDTVIFNNDWEHRSYEEYLKNLKRWKYSLRDCELDHGSVGKIFNLDKLRELGVSVNLNVDRFCRNRYGGALAFSVNIVLESQSRRYYSERKETVLVFGPMVFLPRTDLSEDEMITIVLQDLCGVESALPEPEWIRKFEAPGQEVVDHDIRRIRTEIGSLFEDLRLAEEKREKTRMCLKLLYERGEALEKTTREILRGLGAHVEDPEVTGKEDGWITVQLETETFEGVLEVKSTRSNEFGEDGLRQILDWINRGVELRKKKYKGIFIGSNSVDKPVGERAWGFSDSFKTSSQLHQIVAIKTVDLYVLHLLNAKGELDTTEFWRRLFKTNGIFDSRPYLEMLASTEKKKEK
jgi:hypothetical protein